MHISEEHFISLMIRDDYTISYGSICSCTVIVVSHILETACELSGKYAFQIATVQSFKINYIVGISYSNRAIYYKKDYYTILYIQFSVIYNFLQVLDSLFVVLIFTYCLSNGNLFV